MNRVNGISQHLDNNMTGEGVPKDAASRIVQLEGEITVLQSKIAKLEKDLQKANDKLNNNDEKLDNEEMKQKCVELEDKAELNKSEIEKLRKDIDILRKEKESLLKCKQEAIDCQREIISLRGDIQSSTEKNEDLVRKINTQATQGVRLEEEIRELKRSKQDKEEQIIHLEREVSNLKKQAGSISYPLNGSGVHNQNLPIEGNLFTSFQPNFIPQNISSSQSPPKLSQPVQRMENSGHNSQHDTVRLEGSNAVMNMFKSANFKETIKQLVKGRVTYPPECYIYNDKWTEVFKDPWIEVNFKRKNTLVSKGKIYLKTIITLENLSSEKGLTGVYFNVRSLQNGR